MMAGARPVFADIDPERADARSGGGVAAAITPRTRAILPVHLYGQPADMPALEALAARHSLAVVEDCCQAHLATCDGRPVGTIGVAGALQLLPDEESRRARRRRRGHHQRRARWPQRIRRLRNGGQTDRYHHRGVGVNSRLDEMQAAILRARLPRLPAGRRGGARSPRDYRRCLAGRRGQPCRRARSRPRLSPVPGAEQRSRGAAGAPAARGIETLIHYPVPIPRQPALASETRPSVRSPIASRRDTLAAAASGTDAQAVDAVAVALHEFHAAV